MKVTSPREFPTRFQNYKHGMKLAQFPSREPQTQTRGEKLND